MFCAFVSEQLHVQRQQWECVRGVKDRKIFGETDIKQEKGGKQEGERKRRKQFLSVLKYRCSFSCSYNLIIIKNVTIDFIGYLFLYDSVIFISLYKKQCEFQMICHFPVCLETCHMLFFSQLHQVTFPSAIQKDALFSTYPGTLIFLLSNINYLTVVG